jgi:hypothetical protein
MKNRLIIAAGCCIALAALAGPIKTWQAGEVITANDINANFQHIHNLMVGGHGARLVNADVNANAGIAHSKLATPVLLPKAAALLSSNCNVVGACATDYNQGFSSIQALTTTGSYRFTFSATRPNFGYGIIVQPHIPATANIPLCYVTAVLGGSFDVQCLASSSLTSMSTMANTAQRISVVVIDNDA